MGIACVPGYYCPEGTTVQLGCPIGTYNDQYGQDNCTYCLPGNMCPVVNMTTPEPCGMGIYRIGFILVLSINSVLVCYVSVKQFRITIFYVVGYYCPGRPTMPQPCPAGTYNDGFGLVAETECIYCPPGKYCEGTGNEQPSGISFSH